MFPFQGTDGPLQLPVQVLIADDNINMRIAMGRLIESMFRPRRTLMQTARDGTDAVNLLATHPFDLIITDHEMPGETGITVVREARRHNPTACIILMSGTMDEPLRAAAKAAGATEAIDKSVTSASIEVLLKKAQLL